MRVTNVWDRTADVATWTANGRLCAVAAKSDDSVIVVAACTKADSVQGDGSKIYVKRSTNGGTSFGSAILALDVSGLTGTPAVEMPTLVWDPRNNRLHLLALSTIGLSAGQSWYTNTGVLVRTYSDDNGATWVSPIQMPSTGYHSQWITGGGHYDAATGRLIVAAAGRSASGQPMSPFALHSSDGTTWTAGGLVDTSLTEGESKIIAYDGAWWCLTRTPATLPRRLYTSTDNGASWTAVRSAYPLGDIACNLGMDRIGDAWLYSGPMTYPGIFDAPVVDIGTPRRLGMVLKSRDKGRSWSPVARLTAENTVSAARFFAYSDIKTTASNVYVAYETDSYAKVNVAILTAAEVGA